MDAIAISNSRWLNGTAQVLVRSLAATCLIVSALAGLLVLFRRAAGALSGELPAETAILWMVVLAVVAVLFRRAFVSHRLGGKVWQAYLAWTAPSLVLVSWAAALAASTTTFGWVSLWGIVLAEAAWSWTQLGMLRAVSLPMAERKMLVDASPRSPAMLEEAMVSGASDAAVWQHIDRRQEADGRDSMSGWLRAPVPTGGRHATAHVAICPPFARLPQCYAEQMEGPGAHIRIAQVLPQGVRFEIKLEEPAKADTCVLFEFAIHDPD